MPYEITGCIKRIERDRYDEGCIGDDREWDLDYRANGDDLAKLVRDAFASVGLPDDYVFVGDGANTDETGLLWFSANRQENNDGDEPSATELERFKAGEIDLWLADYCFIIRHVTVRRVTMDELRAAMPAATIE